MATAPRTREQGLAAAMASIRNTPRYCAQWTRLCFGVGALGDYDGDGAADAEDMWKAARKKHPAGTPDGDNPPAGVPVFWGGGSSDNGHAAVSRGQRRIRSTDAAGSGFVGSVDLDFPSRQWGMPYLGWSEDLYGYDITSEADVIREAQEAARKADRERLKKWRKKLWKKRGKINAKLATIKERLSRK